jgi:transcription-repair coupling factor (superfamily II helicase)
VSGLADISRALERGAVVAHGVPPSYAAFAAAELARAGGPVVVVVATDELARSFAADARWFFGADDDAVAVLPGLDTSPYAELAVERAAVIERLATLYRLASNTSVPRVVVASTEGLARRTMPRAELAGRGVAIARGDSIRRDDLVARLAAAGWERVPMVDEPGTFAVRGGVIDVFPPLAADPIRIEMFGDEIETLRSFDVETQRTVRDAGAVIVHPVRDTIATGTRDPRARIRDAADALVFPSRSTRQLIEQLEAGTIVVGLEGLLPAFHDTLDAPAAYVGDAATWIVVDPDAVRRAADDLWEDAEARFGERRATGRFAFPPDAHLVPPTDLAAMLARPVRRIAMPVLQTIATGAETTELRVAVDDQIALRRDLERARLAGGDEVADVLVAALRRWHADGLAIAIGCDGASRLDRVDGLLAGRDIPVHRGALAGRATSAVTLVSGEPSRGFTAAADGVAVISAADLFGPRAAPRRTRTRAKDALLGGVGDFSHLTAGDYLVHQRHGVGRYTGLEKLPYGDAANPAIDFLRLEYDGGNLYLPVFRLGEVQRYVGADGHVPRLDKLGGITWEKARSKAAVHIQVLAEELLQLYAQRATLPGHRFAPDDAEAELVARFPFDETPDQAAAIDAVLGDMDSARAMDRLVCGDVGYGKTEVALRAIFRAAMNGKQSALLCPTTVLVEQHVRTLTERFAGFPIEIGKLSRFQTKPQQTEVVRRLAEGTIDVVVATHRGLSPDVRFKDLGLLVIDEEQRFGVAHKEKLKKLRAHVDVLTLTATPIPRTLHLALTGLRDLSIIATPPADRRAVRTLVAEVDDGVIRRALEHELARGGQIFFITPTIGIRSGTDDRHRTLDEWAEALHELVPAARIGVAHGQLPEAELERVMVQFVGGELDVLVSTTIVESGLDIPRANTMLIARADQFGLAQLYQLRGRIGRSKERAFCYLLVPPSSRITPDARKRLDVLQRFTELGAGFHIASRDLEIRGGGELLGARQSGSIAAVGFDQYVRMLEQAVAQLRGEPIHDPIDPELTVETPGYIPDDYVPDPSQRLDLYKRLSSAGGDDELATIVDDLADRFGPIPIEVTRLCELMAVKGLARALGAQTLELTRSRLALGLVDPETATALASRPGWKRLADGRVAHALGPDDAKAPARAAKRLLLLDAARAT